MVSAASASLVLSLLRVKAAHILYMHIEIRFSFSVPTITNQHKLDGLSEHKKLPIMQIP